MVFLLLAILQVLHAAPPSASICALINKQVPLLRNEQKLEAEGTVRVRAGTFKYDRFLGTAGTDITQSSAVFLSSDGKSVIKMYPGDSYDIKLPQREYWLAKYLNESGVAVPKTKGQPEAVAFGDLDLVTRAFLIGKGMNSSRMTVVVKEHVPGLTEQELRARTDISPEQLTALLKERDETKAAIQKLFVNDKFGQWLSHQGAVAAHFGKTQYTRLDAENKNFILTEQGWVLFDP